MDLLNVLVSARGYGRTVIFRSNPCIVDDAEMDQVEYLASVHQVKPQSAPSTQTETASLSFATNKRETDPVDSINTHENTILLLCTTRLGRWFMRNSVYEIIRAVHENEMKTESGW